MSRLQDILDKADREGSTRLTQSPPELVPVTSASPGHGETQPEPRPVPMRLAHTGSVTAFVRRDRTPELLRRIDELEQQLNELRARESSTAARREVIQPVQPTRFHKRDLGDPTEDAEFESESAGIARQLEELSRRSTLP